MSITFGSCISTMSEGDISLGKPLINYFGRQALEKHFEASIDKQIDMQLERKTFSFLKTYKCNQLLR